MRIKGWMTGLIFFLLAPSLLFASLWFYNRIESVTAIDRRLDGLALIQDLGQLAEYKAITRISRTVPEGLPEALRTFGGPEQADELDRQFQLFLNEDNAFQSLREVQNLIRSIEQQSKLAVASSLAMSEMPQLLTDLLLPVVIETTKLTDNAVRLAGRDQINVWDRILLPVQGGRFKVSADGASRETTFLFDDLTGPGADSLRKSARAYRRANLAFQSDSATLLTSLMNATTGSEITTGPVTLAQPLLVKATFNLWDGILKYINRELMRQRSETWLELGLAGIVAVLIIVGAFGISIALSRALADRTMREFENLGYHDPLTGLPNRRALMKKIRTLGKSNTPQAIGLAVFDLRQFRKTNDRFGDQVGDDFLRAVAEDLKQVAATDDFVCRTAGSEFFLLRPALRNPEQFKEFTYKVLKELCRERTVGETNTALDVNAGLYVHPADEPITDHVLIDATLALRAAKHDGPRKLAAFSSPMRAIFEKNSEIAKELRDALQNDDIVPWFQPQVDIKTGRVVGAEALVRWIDHDGKVRYPGSFLSAAEEAGYMEPIETAVRDQAFDLAQNLRHTDLPRIHLGLNVTAALLASSEATEALHRQVLALGMKPSQFSIEILEAVMIDETAATPVKENIARLSELGFYIELDDFGTGHSSISSLRDLKVDRVKIDRSFISGVDKNPDLQKFTSALINLAKSLDISVLAEGVETEGERLWLQENGCDVIQGFLISKAIPRDQLMAMIVHQEQLQRALAPATMKQAIKA